MGFGLTVAPLFSLAPTSSPSSPFGPGPRARHGAGGGWPRSAFRRPLRHLVRWPGSKLLAAAESGVGPAQLQAGLFFSVSPILASRNKGDTQKRAEQEVMTLARLSPPPTAGVWQWLRRNEGTSRFAAEP